MVENFFDLLNVGVKFVWCGFSYEKISNTHAKKTFTGEKLYFAKKARVVDFI